LTAYSQARPRRNVGSWPDSAVIAIRPAQLSGDKLPDPPRGATQRRHAVKVEAAPIMYVTQLLGGTTEHVIRWLILAVVLYCDPLAMALTAAASARK
jgi:hypothetical protein